MKSVLFVCLGNICRSPAAEGAFLNLLYQENRAHEFKVDSAGTTGHHSGEKADPRMIERAEARGILLPSIARKFEASDFEHYDLIICMDKNNLTNVKKLDLHNKFADKIFLMTDFIKNQKNQDIPDPYYGGSKDFDLVLDLVQEGAQGLLEFIDNNESKFQKK